MSVHAKKSGGEVMMGWNHPCDTVPKEMMMMLKITKKHTNINTLKSVYINFGDYFKKVATTFGPQPLIFAMTEREFFFGISFFVPYRHNSWKEDLTSPIQLELLLHYSSWTLKQFHLSTDHDHHLHILFLGGRASFGKLCRRMDMAAINSRSWHHSWERENCRQFANP